MVIVYSKPDCVQCNATYRSLDRHGVAYEVRMIEDYPEVLEEAKSLGIMQAPYVVHGDQRWGGYRPDIIKEVAREVS